jgi:hypothetical protein
MDTFESRHPDNGWTFEEWMSATRTVRTALAALNVEVPHCLPGEPKDCGTPVWAHYGSYLAILKAHAQLLIEIGLGHDHEHQCPTDYYGTEVYQQELEKMRSEHE